MRRPGEGLRRGGDSLQYRERLRAIKEETIEHALVSAYWLFLEKGIDAVSLADVAKAAEIAPTSLYRYFGNKLNLVLQCGTLFWKQTMMVNNPVRSVPDYAQKTGYEQTVLLMESFVRAYCEYPQHLRFLRNFDLYLERAQVPREALGEYDAALSGWKQIAKDALEHGQRDGTLRTDIDFVQIYYAVTHALLVLAERLACQPVLLDSDLELPPEEQLETIVRMAAEYIRVHCAAGGC